MRAFCLALLCSAAGSLSAQVEIDNDWVRVSRFLQGPHEKSTALPHRATVLVYLTDCHQRITDSHGKAREISRKAGEVSYENPGSQAEENLSSQPLEVVMIELKPAPAKGKTAPVTLDPVQLDPQHHIVVLDNDRVRVLRTILEPHLKAPMHEHPHYVVVYLTGLHTTMLMADGRNIDNVRKPGEIAWREALKHATENVDDRTAIEIQVELK
jgi:quercetin dioxygenase-like cupin family protein